MIANALKGTRFNLKGQKSLYTGKVRDVYNINDDYLIMVVSDRISAFDVVMPKGIPYKGQVLNQIASKFLDATSDIVPNWKIDTPDPNVTVGHMALPYRVEMVIRGYLTGHAWRQYKEGKRELCGVRMPDGLKEHDRFPDPMITPTTKASHGHDEDISREDILASGLVPEVEYLQIEDYTRKLFQRGTEMAAEMGLILVDTKYEFGMKDGRILLIDEIHTPDSSRYFYADGYLERQARGEPQKQLSKEFVRQWLIANGFQGKEGQKVPDMPESFIEEVSERYIELFENITGETFVKADTTRIEQRILNNINDFISG
jgi:phosphoribosylaminoimidazole-succinocarboxamide synthase